MRLATLAAAAALTAAAWTPAQAGEVFGGVFAHDVTFIGDALGVGAAGVEDGVDIHVGYRTEPLEALRVIGRPKAYAFAAINTEGDSSFGGVGLAYTLNVSDRIYVQPGLGVVYTDGEDELPDFREPGITPAEALRRARLRDEKIEFGSQILFEPEIAVGFRLSDRWAAEIAYTHISNAGLGNGQNDGLDDVGVRLVYQLGG